jgi:hypothetical protein
MASFDDLRFLNLQGQRIEVGVSHLGDAQWQLAIETVPVGIYTLLIHQADSVTQHKVVVIR